MPGDPIPAASDPRRGIRRATRWRRPGRAAGAGGRAVGRTDVWRACNRSTCGRAADEPGRFGRPPGAPLYWGGDRHRPGRSPGCVRRAPIVVAPTRGGGARADRRNATPRTARTQGSASGTHEETGHRRVPGEGEDHRPIPGRRIHGARLGGAHPRPHRAEEPAAGAQEGVAREVLGRRRQRVRAVLRGERLEAQDRGRVEAGAQGRRRAVPRH